MEIPATGPLGAFLLIMGTFSLLGASFVVCYTFWSLHWEGWESWSERTGLDADRAMEEADRRRRGD